MLQQRKQTNALFAHSEENFPSTKLWGRYLHFLFDLGQFYTFQQVLDNETVTKKHLMSV